jgi:ABC-2 type transport system permease protein
MNQTMTQGRNLTMITARPPRPAGTARAERAWAGLPGALRAEWTKLRTVPGTAWILTAICVLTVAVGAATAAATKCGAGTQCTIGDPTRVSLTGIEVGQAVVAVLAVLVISGEYSTGMIRTTFTAMPRRWMVLAAKAAVLTALVLAAAVVAVAGSLVAGRLILAGNGITAAHGSAVVSLHGPTVRAAVGSVLYLALVGLLALGIATIVRDSAAATGAVLGILYVPPVIALFLGSEPAWQHWVQRYTPTNAGLAILNTTGLRDLPISPWAGLGVLAAWAAAALLAAGVLLHLRDA